MNYTLRLIVCLAALLIAPVSFAQATAPVTHDRHTHHYNEQHPRVEDPTRFHTSRTGAPLLLPAEDDSFTFIVYGDRTGGPKEGVDILAQAVADTNLIEPDLVMTVGDLVQGYNTTPDWLEQVTQYKSIMDELRCPWFPVAGNHDVYWRGPNRPEAEHEENYEMHLGPLWYAFEHKDCYFIVLYSDEGDAKGKKTFSEPAAQRMSDAQFDWLKETLVKAKDAKHVFIFLHHPRWLRGNYGNDWDKVHAELVKAGNVSAVFAGHIHNMRYDPKDGVEYIALATVGGHQPGHAPSAGYLHHFDIVTVRETQIALSCIPVGGVMDVRAITGEVSNQAEKLARVVPTFTSPITIKDDGSVSAELSVTIKNPSIFAIDIEARPVSDDSRWAATPDHAHARLKPGESRTLTFVVTRPAGAFDTTARGLTLDLGIDLLTDRARFPIPSTQTLIPGSIILSEDEKAPE